MLTTGIDITEIALIGRMFDRHGARFLMQVYTEREQCFCQGRVALLACLFAAKEGIAKALGTGLSYLAADGTDLREMEIIAGQCRCPSVQLHGAAQVRATALGLTEWSVSFDHSRTYAIALVVARDGAGVTPDDKGG